MGNPCILIISAIANEIAPLTTSATETETIVVGGRSMICAKLQGNPVNLLVTGVGLVNTAQALTAAIEYAEPEVVIQTGCAGAFKESGLSVGDVALATEEIDVQLGVEKEEPAEGIAPLPFPVLKTNETNYTNRYSLKTDWIDSLISAISEVSAIKERIVQKGPFVTVSTVTASSNTADRLYRMYSACMESMEGSAAAHICLHYKIPLVEIRSASNMVGERDKKKWNLDLAFKNSGIAVMSCLEKIASEISH